MLEQALHPCDDPCEHHSDLLVGRRRQGPKIEGAIRSIGEEDAVEQQRVEVDVQIQPAPEALDHRHRARPPVADAVPTGAVSLEAEQDTHMHAEHRPRQRVIPRQQVA